MGWANKLIGWATVNGAEVTANNRLLVSLGDATTQASQTSSIREFSEVDSGAVTGSPLLMSPEADEDFRLRTAIDILRDEENFNYTTQNTGKHAYANTTMTNAWSVGAMTTNSGNIVTTTTGTSFGSYAFFPIYGTNTLSFDIEAFSAQPTANTVIDFGGFLRGAANPYVPTDGAYFRLTSAGLQGVVNYNGTETATGVFLSESGGPTWTYTNNKRYQFIIYVSVRRAEFWINTDGSTVLYGVINVPSGNGQPCASSSLPFSVRHAITGGAAGAALSFQVARYSVRSGGSMSATTPSVQGNRLYGSYQGLSGGTMGSLANYANSANPTAAVPTNTTAALGTGLGGQFWETVSLAVNTDGIICSYQVPLGTASVQGRRLSIRGVYLTSYVQTVIVGGPYVSQYSLTFGHTNVSLATTEAAAAKAPRRVALPFTQILTAAQAVSTLVAQTNYFCDFGDAPIFVNPGEFVALVTKHIGTAGTSGTVAHTVTFIYGWE